MISSEQGIFFIFTNPDLTVRIAAAVLVGAVGVLSFVRHSVYFASDQVRMGWHQDRPEFQLEVGYANLAIGIWALVAAVLGRGLVCGVMLATCGPTFSLPSCSTSRRPGHAMSCMTGPSARVQSGASSQPGFSYWHLPGRACCRLCSCSGNHNFFCSGFRNRFRHHCPEQNP